MNVKGKFVSVEGIRSYETTDSNGQKITKWVVKYLIEFDYPRKDGTMGKQQILAEVHYTEQPNYVVGPLNDPNVYDMQFHFKVRRGKNRNGEDYIVQDITLYKASQSVI
ncbi:MAG: hypothetical protein J6Y05_00325 [Bacteroidales bacterium]|nr:hypothetical protein [Bacteroidales bacterium]